MNREQKILSLFTMVFVMMLTLLPSAFVVKVLFENELSGDILTYTWFVEYGLFVLGLVYYWFVGRRSNEDND